MKKPRKLKQLDPNTVQLIKQVLAGVVVLSAVALLLTGIWHGTRLPGVTITQIEVQGGETINHGAVRETVSRTLEGEYMNFVPRRFTYFYPKDEIIERVGEYERVHNVEVRRLGRKAVSVRFDEYVPTALWCTELESHDCLFVDQSGLAFGTAPELSGGSLLRFQHTSEAPEINKLLLPNEDLVRVLELVERFEDEGWFTSWVEVDQARDAFLHIVGGGELKVTLAQLPEETVENLRVILVSEDFSDIEPGNFAYIDLRFGSKVFVNRTGGVEPETELSATTSAAERGVTSTGTADILE